MEKRVTFKNASSQPNKRARLTHGTETQVNVGDQSGAVYYEQPEIGMCYSKPMEIIATADGETQCVSLVGLYDLFIDGVRVGRGMTQEEILERVNAGNYGVEVSPCLTVSCADTAAVTNCLTLTGQWDVEINDVRIVEDADQARILAVLARNPEIRAEICRPKCTASGEYSFNMDNVPEGTTFAVGSELIFAFKISDLDEVSAPRYQLFTLRFETNRIEVINQSSYIIDTGGRTPSTEPWTYDEVILALQYLDLQNISGSTTPNDWTSTSLNYCKDGMIKYKSEISFQNTYALTRQSYYYTGGLELKLGTLTTPIVHMRLDDIELTPYTWVPSGEERTVIERAALEHFKTQLEAHGLTCEIIEDVYTNTPPAFSGGPVTSTLSLVAKANYQFRITTSKQWEGTANHPELNNIENGWAETAIGLMAWGQGFGSSGLATADGCALGSATAAEVNLTTIITGISESDISVIGATFMPAPAKIEMVSLASEGITLAPNQLDITTIYPELLTQEPLYSCGYYQNALMETM